MGGTCVNVGCVPKKVMYNTSYIKENIEMAPHYGFNIGDVSFDWNVIKVGVAVLNGMLLTGINSSDPSIPDKA